jgi:hypothetical protein
MAPSWSVVLYSNLSPINCASFLNGVETKTQLATNGQSSRGEEPCFFTGFRHTRVAFAPVSGRVLVLEYINQQAYGEVTSCCKPLRFSAGGMSPAQGWFFCSTPQNAIPSRDTAARHRAMGTSRPGRRRGTRRGRLRYAHPSVKSGAGLASFLNLTPTHQEEVRHEPVRDHREPGG